jgi:hypothetical protein
MRPWTAGQNLFSLRFSQMAQLNSVSNSNYVMRKSAPGSGLSKRFRQGLAKRSSWLLFLWENTIQRRNLKDIRIKQTGLVKLTLTPKKLKAQA